MVGRGMSREVREGQGTRGGGEKGGEGRPGEETGEKEGKEIKLCLTVRHKIRYACFMQLTTQSACIMENSCIPLHEFVVSLTFLGIDTGCP